MIAKLGVQARNILLLDEIDPIRSITDFFAMPRRSEDPIWMKSLYTESKPHAARPKSMQTLPSLSLVYFMRSPTCDQNIFLPMTE